MVVISVVPATRCPSSPGEAEGRSRSRGRRLTDGVWDRSRFEAIRRELTASAAAGPSEPELPRSEVERAVKAGQIRSLALRFSTQSEFPQ